MANRFNVDTTAAHETRLDRFSALLFTGLYKLVYSEMNKVQRQLDKAIAIFTDLSLQP